jgi:hypothetical protein
MGEALRFSVLRSVSIYDGEQALAKLNGHKFSSSRRLLQQVLYSRKHSDGAGKPNGSSPQSDYLLQLLDGDAHGERLSHIRANGTFFLPANGNSKFEEPARLVIQRSFSARHG